MIELHEETIETRTGTKSVLIAQPKRLVVVNAADVEARRASTEPSEIDALLIAAIERQRYDVFCFQAGDGNGNRRYALGDDIAQNELVGAGALLVRGQIPLYRALVHRGVIAVVSVEMGDRELAAFRDGTAHVMGEIEERGGTRSGTERFDLDLWLLRHLALFSSMSLHAALTQLLPNMIPMLEPRATRIQRML